MSDAVLLDHPRPDVAVIMLNRPEKLNAMNRDLVVGLHQALDEVDAATNCRVAIITGAGRGFWAGIDLGGYGIVPGSEAMGNIHQLLHIQQEIAQLIPHLRSVRKPVIAAVNGPAAGGGFAVVLGADIRIAAASARFNVAFVRIGLSGCDMGVRWLLPRLVGAARAHELLLTGRIFDALEAERIGLVTQVVPDSELIDAAMTTADLVCANRPFGIWMTKEVMWSNLEVSSQRAAIELENRTQVLASQTADMAEAMSAFLQKRPPNFENR